MQNGERMIEANGIKHWVKIVGAEHATVPLVAMHGGPGGHHWIFERIGGPLLEEFATVIYYEQRGCGRSEAPEQADDYSIELLVKDLDQLRQALGLEKIIPMGHSFGGELALEYALAYPQHVERVILEAPAMGDWERLAINQLFGFMAVTEGETRTEIRNLLNEGAPYVGRNRPAWGLTQDPIHERFTFFKEKSARLLEELWTKDTPAGNESMRLAIVNTADSRLLERIRSLRLPVMIMGALHDRNTGIEMARDILVNLPHGKLVIFEQSGHYIHMDEPDKMASEIRQFIR